MEDKKQDLQSDTENLEALQAETGISDIIDGEADIVDELEKKLKACEDKYIRANADFENIKKRYEKEKYQAIDYANEQFAKDLLSVIDALDMAYKSGEEASDEVAKKIKEGIGLTLEQFKKAFEKHGIREIISEGKFDPNFHNAVLQVESEEKESGDIVQTFQKGYTIRGRVLREAMVTIAK